VFGRRAKTCRIPIETAFVPVTQLSRRSRELAFERPHLFKSLCHVAQKRCDAHYFTAPIPQQHDREFDRHLTAVLPDCWHRENIALTIAASSRLHGTVVAVPMALTQPLRDDDIEGLAKSFSRGEPEYSFRARVPEPNEPPLSAATMASDRVERTA
jgi:hypothetical protein